MQVWFMTLVVNSKVTLTSLTHETISGIECEFSNELNRLLGTSFATDLMCNEAIFRDADGDVHMLAYSHYYGGKDVKTTLIRA